MDTYKTLEELLKDYPQQTLGQGYDYAGQRYNMITRISNPNKTGTYWAAQCDCGNYFPVYVPNVVRLSQTQATIPRCDWTDIWRTYCYQAY